VPPFLDASELHAATFIRHIELHETLGSTNERAAELAREPSIELPALIATRLQTAGKGRGRHKWWAAEGALTFSILLEPDTLGISTQRWPQLSLTTAVAICDALSRELHHERAGASPPPSANNATVDATDLTTHGRAAAAHGLEDEPARSAVPQPLIKWPNDVYIDGKKIAGILIESPGSAAQAKDRLIIGIGVNVNNSSKSAPLDVSSISTAMCDVTGRSYDLQQVLSQILQSLQHRYQQLAENPRGQVKDWQNLSLLTGRKIEVQSGDHRITGTCLGIDDTAAILVEVSSQTHHIHSGSVRII
jgi:BirA family biotin operon repressor/biotin-[acetyl-CoA-carboxylase] ligase